MIFLFAAFAAVLVASSLLVILHKNPVTSALFLVLAFCALAAIYLLLRAEFVGMVQVIVYAGAIMVLFLFVIMYLNLGHDVEGGLATAVRRGLGWVVGAVLLAEGALLLARGWVTGPTLPEVLPTAGGNTRAIGVLLYSRYLFPFEITSILLLVAMVGAIVITRGRGAAGREVSPARVASAPPAAAPAAPATTVMPAAPAAPRAEAP